MKEVMETPLAKPDNPQTRSGIRPASIPLVRHVDRPDVRTIHQRMSMRPVQFDPGRTLSPGIIDLVTSGGIERTPLVSMPQLPKTPIEGYCRAHGIRLQLGIPSVLLCSAIELDEATVSLFWIDRFVSVAQLWELSGVPFVVKRERIEFELAGVAHLIAFATRYIPDPQMPRILAPRRVIHQSKPEKHQLIPYLDVHRGCWELGVYRTYASSKPSAGERGSYAHRELHAFAYMLALS